MTYELPFHTISKNYQFYYLKSISSNFAPLFFISFSVFVIFVFKAIRKVFSYFKAHPSKIFLLIFQNAYDHFS